jgi:hypothetical protein
MTQDPQAEVADFIQPAGIVPARLADFSGRFRV